MKKLVVAVIAIFMGTTVFSQSLDFGIKLGANFSSISDVNDMSSKTGFQGGLFAGIKFNKVAIQGDILYSQQGAKFKPGKFDLDYVNIPIVIKYYLIQGLNIQVGPQFGFVVGDEVEEGYDYNKSDISGVVGAGYDLPFGIRVDARYNIGFTDTFKEKNTNTDKGKSNVFSLALGYSFL